MYDAFIDGDQVAAAIDAGLSGRCDLEAALAAVEGTRNHRARAMYELTNQLAALEPPPVHMQELFAASAPTRRRRTRFFRRLPELPR